MKKSLSIFIVVLISLNAFSVDVIVTKDVKSIKCTIVEVSKLQVKYKAASNPQGPIFILDVSDIETIVYDNGIVQMFNDKQSTNTPSSSSSNAMQVSEAVPDDRFPIIDIMHFHGFLLQKGNCVYIPIDSEVEYELAAQKRFKELMLQKQLWQVVDKVEQSHFVMRVFTATNLSPDNTVLNIYRPDYIDPQHSIITGFISGETVEENIRATNQIVDRLTLWVGKGYFDDFKSFKKLKYLGYYINGGWQIP